MHCQKSALYFPCFVFCYVLLTLYKLEIVSDYIIIGFGDKYVYFLFVFYFFVRDCISNNTWVNLQVQPSHLLLNHFIDIWWKQNNLEWAKHIEVIKNNI